MEVCWLIINLKSKLSSQTYRQLGMTVHLEPVGADQVLLVEHGVVGTEEVEVLELKY